MALLKKRFGPRPLPDHPQLDLPIRTPEETVQHYEAALEYICETDPVARQIGEKLSRGYGAAQIVEEEIERKNMRLQAILAKLQENPPSPRPNDGILRYVQSHQFLIISVAPQTCRILTKFFGDQSEDKDKPEVTLEDSEAPEEFDAFLKVIKKEQCLTEASPLGNPNDAQPP
ncbi:hypothetical protein CAEBREN_05218 [Caenorhabditis brenneri]|uniref:Uncharacterized protein n=1 Tax=Caenorhabditis brenneri TaxID=135651 RepID=G0NZM0_CAEBE|nr:hypothetical protein CAEBREN_05218 [Caenorhabditis brenneri]